MPLRLVMLGTGTFALPTFEALCESDHDIVGLFTQPDRGGPGKHRHRHPMKESAVERGVPVFQPADINAAEALDEFRGLQADLAVVAAYGQILSAEMLSIPRLGAVNLHGSILPKYRGAAPVQHAVLNGETESGVTLFQIEPKLDAGPIYGTARVPVGPDMTSGELHDLLADESVGLCLDVLAQLEAGTAMGQVQDAAQVTRAPKLAKTDGEIDWNRDFASLHNHIRGMQPWPKAQTSLHQGEHRVRLTVYALRRSDPESLPAEALRSAENVTPGTVAFSDGQRLVVRCGDGLAELVEIQPAGKRRMAVADYLRGHGVAVGDRLGPDGEADSDPTSESDGSRS